MAENGTRVLSMQCICVILGLCRAFVINDEQQQQTGAPAALSAYPSRAAKSSRCAGWASWDVTAVTYMMKIVNYVVAEMLDLNVM